MPEALISLTEVTQVHDTALGYCLPVPWFRDATIKQLGMLAWPTEYPLHCPFLDIDLPVESIPNPSAFPLITIVPAPNAAIKQDAPTARLSP